jgi:hypothetical protein
MDLKSQTILSHSHFQLLDSIKALKNQGNEVTVSSIASLYGKTKKKSINRTAIERYLRDIRDRLKWVLHLDHFPQEEHGKYAKSILPNYENALMLIDYCEQSDLIALLKRAQYAI